MKTESRGGSTADSMITRNLARLFGEELDRAERDFPSMRTPLRDALEGRRARGRMRVRLGAQGIAVAAVAVIVAGSGWLTFALWAAPTGPGDNVIPAGSATLLGADGIPNLIDGERVYRVGEKVEYEKQGGYLLGGYVFGEVSNCPADTAPSEPCFGLGPKAGSDARTGGIDVSVATEASDPNPPALGGWLGMPVVVRAKGCTWDNGTPCPPVVMAILWPAVPTKVAGERVYRATNQTLFAGMNGSFLLGGVYLKPDVVAPCPAPIGQSTAEQQLLPYCFVQSIDGLKISPMSSIAEPGKELVVARVHVNDSLAEQCPAAALADCKAAIVVESVVWRSDELITAAPSMGANSSGAASLVAPSTNPTEPSTGMGPSSPSPGASTLLPPTPNPSPGASTLLPPTPNAS